METVEKEEKEINDALSLSEEERSLSSGIFNILGTLIKGEPSRYCTQADSADSKRGESFPRSTTKEKRRNNKKRT